MSSGWTYTVREDQYGDVQAILHHPSQVVGREALIDTQPIVYLRDFARPEQDEEYVEVDQRLAHLLDLNWMVERQSFYGINDPGDIVDAITVHQHDLGKLVTMDATTLQK